MHKSEYVLLTNHLDLDAIVVAAVYTQRCQIELLFRALKQNLRIKTFIGTSAYALKIQLWRLPPVERLCNIKQLANAD